MKLRVFFTLFLLMSLSFSLFTQNDSIYLSFSNKLENYLYKDIDSLEKYLSALKTYSEDNNYSKGKVLYFDFKARKFSLDVSSTDNNLDSFIFYNKLAISLGEKNNIDVAYHYYNLAYEHIMDCKTKEVLKYSHQLFEYAEANGDINSKNKYNSIRATLYTYCLNQYDSAISYYKASLNHYRTTKDSIGLAVNLENIGLVYIELKDYVNSLVYLKEALIIEKKLNSIEGEIFCKSQIASVELNLGNVELSEKYLKESVKYYKESKQFFRLGDCSHILGLVYLSKGELKKSEKWIDVALDKANRLGNNPSLINYLQAKATILNKKKEYKKCIEIITEALELNKSVKILKQDARLMEILYQCQSKLGRHQESFVSLKRYMILKDSLNSEEQKINIKEIEEKYENVKKEAEIDALKLKSKLDNQQKINQRNWLLGIIFLITIISLFFFFLYRNRQKTNTKLKEIDKVKTRFFENISHEFRTPLTLIKLPISRALKTDESLDKQELNLMHNNTSRLQNLIEDLLSLSELDAGKMTIHKSSQDPLIQTKVLSSQFDSYANSKGIEYHKSIENKALIATYDKSVVEKVMTNLISNAIKYSEKGGTVQVSVSVDNANLIMKVSDSGEGISKENQAKIFDRFYQVGEKDESKHGSGIGLALVKRVLELNNGNISLESQEGVGSTFTATLPIENISRYTNPVKQEEIPVKKENKMANLLEEVNLSDKPVLLIAEDNRELLTYISGLFRQDFEIIQAINGEEGMEKAFKLVPDIVISDWMMPKMNGIEFLTKLKTHSATSHIPFILLTAKADVEDKITGYETGADAYFSKPFNFEELKALLTNLILQRKALYEKFSDPTNEELEAPIKNSRDILFWQEIKKYIIANLKRPENLLTDKVCDTFSMSRMQLHRKLTALTGHGLGALVKNQKMNHAAKLLKDPALRISEVCFELGYNDNSAFARAFKKEMGLTPSEYKKKYAK